MFEDSPEGQTHYFGDGCPEHPATPSSYDINFVIDSLDGFLSRSVPALTKYEKASILNYAREDLTRAYAAGQKADADDHEKALTELREYWEFKVKDAKEEAYAAGVEAEKMRTLNRVKEIREAASLPTEDDE